MVAEKLDLDAADFPALVQAAASLSDRGLSSHEFASWPRAFPSQPSSWYDASGGDLATAEEWRKAGNTADDLSAYRAEGVPLEVAREERRRERAEFEARAQSAWKFGDVGNPEREHFNAVRDRLPPMDYS